MGYAYRMSEQYAKVKEWRKTHKENRAEEARRWRAKHPDIAKEIKQRYREKSREERLPREAEIARKRRAADPEGQRIRSERWRKKRETERERLAGRPKPGLCEICGECNIRIVFDHCHRHGHFRGWICDRCNRVLGLIKDSPEILGLLARYLVNGKIEGSNAQPHSIE
jgi:hypothetical protein